MNSEGRFGSGAVFSRSRWLQLAVLSCVLWAPSAAYAEIPPRPVEGMIWDSAELLNQDDRQVIERYQQEALEQQGATIMVVTLHRLADYGGDADDMESFARKWFDTWQIGLAGKNIGVLLLVSDGDRRARIELGADWGRGWDGRCAQIMNGDLVPEFKRGDYSKGILAGVRSLTLMAKERATRPVSAGSSPSRIDYAPSVRAVEGIGGFACLFMLLPVLFFFVILSRIFSFFRRVGGGYTNMGYWPRRRRSSWFNHGWSSGGMGRRGSGFSRGGGAGRGWSGGSSIHSGGGFSGGGGASGRW
ncbi:MAG: hypothetical protein HJJLKODD_00416 [Phycisphaerae bacterium]|nr:hypothetical protein [Phycisphaerae bacterium]